MTTPSSHSRLRLAAVLIPSLISVPLVLGFFGSAHPLFDAFAHFRMHLAVLMAISAIPALILGLWREGLMSIVFALTALGTVLIPTPAPSAEGGSEPASNGDLPEFKLMQLNLRYDNRDQSEVIRTIAREAPDVITLQEVSDDWRSRLKAVEGRYPHKIVCPSTKRVGGVAILSRRPFALGTTPQCVGNSLMALARIDFGGRSALIASVHLGWPWPFEQAENVEEMQPYLVRLGGPIILAGDFNAAPWSQTIRNLVDASNTHPVDGLRPSWLINGTFAHAARWIGLPIDHVLVSERIAAKSVDSLQPVGSDHLPLLLRFSIEGVDDNGPDEQTVMLRNQEPGTMAGL
ncbi:endonuclease/exonuclease/phosphatase family protein [Phyllobacterium sp. SYP-B3895]|uniref:endonuclease/exonuclease/phosphatase family protein n=1 Tax=Phyllobacterium sp. SYP-B3895 TaxID=2663240 RepID=UPI001562B179|nr:endonuclease/exonuclease/phosphatase family protein [Phyllobacterium sp. SYP-B3895]